MRLTTWNEHNLADPKEFKLALNKFRASGRATGLWPTLLVGYEKDGTVDVSHRTDTSTTQPQVSAYLSKGVLGRAGTSAWSAERGIKVSCTPGRYVESTLWLLVEPRGAISTTFWCVSHEVWKRDLGAYRGQDAARWR